MSLTNALALAAILALLLVWALMRRRGGGSGTTPAERGERLDTVAAWPPSRIRILSAREREAYALLRGALPEYTVLAQVPLARFLKVPKRHSYTEWLRRIGNQCADLVVCDDATEVIAVVDIHPPAEEMSERSRKRHDRIERALATAGVPLHVWIEDRLPSPRLVREAIMPKGAAVVTAAPSTVQPSGLEEDVEVIEMREPPPSTWFDEFDTAPAPLRDENKPR